MPVEFNKSIAKIQQKSTFIAYKSLETLNTVALANNVRALTLCEVICYTFLQVNARAL